VSAFRKATKKNSKVRLALSGPSGAGKTMTLLRIATGLLADGSGNGRIAVIDTERGSASKYSDLFDFDVMEIGVFDPRLLVEAIQAAEKEGYSAIGIDSLSHFWIGKGGALDMVEAFKVRSKSGNAFTEGWSKVTPIQNAMYEAILGSSAHVIATMRTKTEYVTETDPRTGKTMPRKVGLAPVQREGIIYEFDIEGDLDTDHNLIVGKTRWSKIDGQVIPKAGEEFGRALAGWLSDGPLERAAAAAPTSLVPPGQAPVDYAAVPVGLATPDLVARLKAMVGHLGMTGPQARAELARRNAARFDQLSMVDATAWLRQLESIASVDEFRDRIGLAGEATEAPPVNSNEVHARAAALADQAGPDAPGDPAIPATPTEPPANGRPADAPVTPAPATSPIDESDSFEIPDQARPESIARPRRQKATA
jgi:KaiC/GvpD/RAD55 family RecA-like ATPase